MKLGDSFFRTSVAAKSLYLGMRLTSQQMELIKQVFSKEPVLRAFVFGSYARDEADEASDIDLLVELDYSQRIGLEFIAMQQKLEELLQAKVDLVSTGSLSKRLRPYIDQEKQLIYERVGG